MAEKVDPAQMLETLKHYYLEWLPFNKVLGVRIDHLDYDTGKAVTSFPLKPDLIGNSTAGILHGGVTAAVIDLTGGLSALVCCAKAHIHLSPEQIQEKLVSSATIDMRVDYLRPGKGDMFTCTSLPIKAGSRIVVCRIDLVNDKDQDIAAGTATYTTG